MKYNMNEEKALEGLDFLTDTLVSQNRQLEWIKTFIDLRISLLYPSSEEVLADVEKYIDFGKRLNELQVSLEAMLDTFFKNEIGISFKGSFEHKMSFALTTIMLNENNHCFGVEIFPFIVEGTERPTNFKGKYVSKYKLPFDLEFSMLKTAIETYKLNGESGVEKLTMIKKTAFDSGNIEAFAVACSDDVYRADLIDMSMSNEPAVVLKKIIKN